MYYSRIKKGSEQLKWVRPMLYNAITLVLLVNTFLVNSLNYTIRQFKVHIDLSNIDQDVSKPIQLCSVIRCLKIFEDSIQAIL